MQNQQVNAGRPDGGQAIEIAIEQHPTGILVARVTGEVDVRTAPMLRQGLTERLTDGRAFVLDMDGVAFLGSAGLSALLETREQADERGVRWAIVASRIPVSRPLRITGLEDILSVHETVSDAITAVTE